MSVGNVHFVEKNVRGAWVVYGALGVRQYYGYTKEEALKRYNDECDKTLFTDKKLTRGENHEQGEH